MATGDLLAQDRQAKPIALQRADRHSGLCARRVCVAAVIVLLLLGSAGCGDGPPARGLWPFQPPAYAVRISWATDADIASWQKGLKDGDYASVIEQTTEFLDEHGIDIEASLYLGLAELASGDSNSGLADLSRAESMERFPDQRSMEDRVLLCRGLMVSHAQLGNTDMAYTYLQKAIKLAPDRETIIRYEYDTHTLSVQDLFP